MSNRLALSARRDQITQKVRVAGQRTLYLSVHDDARPTEIFLRLKGSDCSSELIDLYNVCYLHRGSVPYAIAGLRTCIYV